MKTFLLLFIFSLKSYANSNIYFSTDYRPGIGRIFIYLGMDNNLELKEDDNHCSWDDFGARVGCTFVGSLPKKTSLVFLKEDRESKLFRFTNIYHLRLAVSKNNARILIMDPRWNNVIDVLPLKANFPIASTELLYNNLNN